MFCSSQLLVSHCSASYFTNRLKGVFSWLTLHQHKTKNKECTQMQLLAMGKQAGQQSFGLLEF